MRGAGPRRLLHCKKGGQMTKEKQDSLFPFFFLAHDFSLTFFPLFLGNYTTTSSLEQWHGTAFMEERTSRGFEANRRLGLDEHTKKGEGRGSKRRSFGVDFKTRYSLALFVR
jgi:hypothetical protein